MKNHATALSDARFWVRPYEFEGDGSTGGADDVASLEIGGKVRTFRLKTLENRLFFREIGRDEDWNFGALDVLAQDADLPVALARALSRESYGRVVLPFHAPRPCLFLASPTNDFWFGATRSPMRKRGEWKPHKANRNLEFLDRPAKYFQTLYEPSSESAFERQAELFSDLFKLPKPSVQPRWLLGSEQEWRRVATAFFQFWWARFGEEDKSNSPIRWQLRSAWAMENMYFQRLDRRWNYRTPVALGLPALQHRADWLVRQFHFAGQDKNREKSPNGEKLGFGPCVVRGTVSEPTHHEILEAHVFLREWIGQKLPLAKAKKWLDVS